MAKFRNVLVHLYLEVDLKKFTITYGTTWMI